MSDQTFGKKKIILFKLPGIIAYVAFLIATLFATLWGTVEFFHEGWYPPYTQGVFYAMPIVIFVALLLFTTFFPRIGGAIIVLAGGALVFFWYSRLQAQHADIEPSLYIAWIVMLLPGIFFLLDGFLRKKIGYRRPEKFSFRFYWRHILAVALPLILIIALCLPLLLRNLGRIPLEDFGEVTVAGNGVTLTLAGDGPGWFYSNTHPLVFDGKEYKGLSWNQIALFGMEPIGFEGKRYGPGYDGTRETLYFATQEDFEKFNMFRYLNYQGTELKETVQDHWRLPSPEEYVRILPSREENAGGQWDTEKGRAQYATPPDKDAPIWAPDMEVIYYWTSVSADEKRTYCVWYTGEVYKVNKTAAADYRGFRAVRNETADSESEEQ